MTRARRLLLATCGEFPDGGPESVLVDVFAARGVDARWAIWDDPDVDWAAAEMVAVRTTWDYPDKLDAFISWTRVVGQQTRLVNDAAVIAWNTDKRYLLELHEWGLPIVPSVAAQTEYELDAALASYDAAVIKPIVGAGGNDVVTWHSLDPVPAVDGPLLVQPLVESVRTDGEISVYVLGGRPASQLVKRPTGSEIRVHQHRGGVVRKQRPDPALASLAEQATKALTTRFAVPVPYARVDLLNYGGSWVLSELEVVEPGLNLDVDPGLAEVYADAMVEQL